MKKSEGVVTSRKVEDGAGAGEEVSEKLYLGMRALVEPLQRYLEGTGVLQSGY